MSNKKFNDERRRAAKARQRAARRVREKGLSTEEVIALRQKNVLEYCPGNQNAIQIVNVRKAKERRALCRAKARLKRLVGLSEAQNHRCCYCGQQTWHPAILDGDAVPHNDSNRATREHITARANGGTFCKDNLAMACSQCNGTRGSTNIDNFIARIVAKSIKSPTKEECVAVKKKELIKRQRLFKLLMIATVLNPNEFEALIEQYQYKSTFGSPKRTNNNIIDIRYRVIENNMMFA